MENKALLVHNLERASLFLLGILLILFPILITTFTTDAYVIPKQALLITIVTFGIIVLAVKWVLTGSVRIRRTPYDVPVVLFGIALLLSSIFAVNKADSFISFVPFLFALLTFFVISNSAKKERDVLFLSGSLIIGSIIVSAISLLSYLKVYILPFAFTKAQAFTPFGSLFDQLLYLVLVLSLCLYMAWPALKKRGIDKGRLIFVFGAVFVLAGSIISLLGALTIQKPTILPFDTGFQTAFSSISQDTGRVVQGFLMGSGVGTYLNDFTRFKPVTFNLNSTLWNLSFLRSSTFALELVATTGVLGIISFLFLAYRIVRTRPFFPPLLLVLVFALVLPFSYSSVVILFVLLGLYSAQEGILDRQKNRFFDVELKLVTLRRGVFALTDPGARADSEYQNVLPYGILAVIVLFYIIVGLPTLKFLFSDYLFQQSLVAASQNNAQATYQLETRAINMFPQRDGYHRIFSQINLTLANNLAASIPQGTSPSAQVSNTIYQLIQQSINSGRNAANISPQTALNWQNLSSIYRSLIGFGQNADNFAMVSAQQALVLDPNNPQEYINYGGIFYQLGQWDNAIRQFQIAATLKPDFANAYYNLGHALEQKGDLKGALAQYQTVKSLVTKDQVSLNQINTEIKALEDKIGAASTPSTQAQATENQPPIEVNQPSAKLPEQNPPVKIPGPKGSPTPTPKTSPSPSAKTTPAPSLAQ